MSQGTKNKPLYDGRGASFSLHTLQEASAKELIFKPTIKSYLFGGTFLMAGCFGILASVVIAIMSDQVLVYLGLIGGLLLSFLGWRLIRIFSAPRVINLVDNQVVTLKDPYSIKCEKEVVSFSAINALQIVPKKISTSKNVFTVFELNIVLKDGARHNLTQSVDRDQVSIDAHKIARFIGSRVVFIPVE